MGRNSKDDIRKPQILEHFRAVINEEGFHKASIARVAKHMGMSPNLIVHYFKSKEAMVLELCDLLLDEYFEFISVSTDDQKEGVPRIKSMLKRMFGMEGGKQLLVENSFYALYYISLSNEQVKQRLNQQYDKQVNRWTKDIQSAIQAGEINPSDPVKMAALVLSLLEGFSFMANMQTNGHYIEDFGRYFYEKAWTILKAGDSDLMLVSE